MTRRALFFVATLLSLALLAGACGGDGEQDRSATATATPGNVEPPTALPASERAGLQDYFVQVALLAADFEGRGQALGDELDRAFLAPEDEEGIAAIVEFLDSAIVLFDDFISSLEAIDPPGAVQDTHDEAVASGRGAIAVFRDLQDEAQAAETQEDLEVILDVLAGRGDDLDRFGASCEALQAIADVNEIEADLLCGS